MQPKHYHSDQVAAIVGGTLQGTANPQAIHTLLIDSRKVTNAAYSLFFAIRGERHDGHDYLLSLYSKGLRVFVVEQAPQLIDFPQATFIVVHNSLRALQQLAAHHRNQLQLPVLAITGSNGKTILKEWLFQLLQQDLKIVRSPKSYNSQVGVPLSVWNLRPQHDLGVFEAGISQPGEMPFLAKVIHPTLGLFGNIGSAHQENFKSIEEKVDEKLALFESCDSLIYCRDHEEIHQGVLRNPNLQKVVKWTWSQHQPAQLKLVNTQKTESGTQVSVSFGEQPFSYFLPFSDRASIENSLHCTLILLFLGYSGDTIAQRMPGLAPVAMRLEIQQGVNDCTVINDSYNSDLGSLSVALDLLDQQQQHSKKTVILSDVLGSGLYEPELYHKIANLLAQHKVERLIGVGPAFQRQKALFSLPEQRFFSSTQALFQFRKELLFRNEAILVKGARPYAFEGISQVLQREHHETVLEINLEALVHNLNHFRSRLNSRTKIMVMVKAFSYGSGSHEIANLLAFHRVDYLAVAYADEGVALRQAGIHLPIMVMNPEPSSHETMIRYHLEPEIYRLSSLLQFADDLLLSAFFDGQPFPVHLKLDTGMHRLGFELSELEPLLAQLPLLKHLKVESVFTHLSSSDDPQEDDFTRQQIAQFEAMSNRILPLLPYPVMKHCLNSAGIQRFPEAQFDLVRLGIGLHGIGVNATEQKHLEPAATLRTVISQIKTLEAGESIGYGRAGRAIGTTQVATVAIGYADGLSRHLSRGKGKMLINGHLAPVIGNVCMDMTMLDVTNIPAQEGDEVVVFGKEHPISELAETLETIPYEVLSGISQRVRRVYYQE